MSENEIKLKKYFLELPPNYQKAINALDWKKIAQEIGRSKSLGIEQIESLETETLLVIYDITSAEEYIPNLVKELSVSEQDAQYIASEITNKVFRAIENMAKKIEAENIEPVIITPETKKAVIAELSQRVEAAKEAGATIKPTTYNSQPTTKPEEKPAENLPMVESGEVAHEVPHEETTTDDLQATTETKPSTTIYPQSTIITEEKKRPEIIFPKSAYESGKDPYREPIN